MALFTQAPTATKKKELTTFGAGLLKMFHDDYQLNSKSRSMEFERGKVIGWRFTLALLYGERTCDEIVAAAAEEANLTIPPACSVDDDGNWLGFDSGAHSYIGKLHKWLAFSAGMRGNGMKSQFLRASAILMLMTTILLPLALTQTTKISLTPATEKTTGTSFANAQLKYLPTQKEAAQKAKDQSQTGGIQALLHQSMSIDDAVHDARAEEITAITSGHSELVAPEDLDDCKQAIMLNAEKKAEDAAKNAVILRARNIAQAQLKDQLEKNHCDSYVHIGITETCVFILMGGPLHTNDDKLAGIMQLVYDHDYIYIDKNGRVENIQSSH